VIPPRGAMTIRIPVELANRARQIKAAEESFNDLVIEAVEREVRRRQGIQAFAVIQKTRAQVEARTGAQPDSVPLLRTLREEMSDG
jgi:hypothetical protein